MTFGAIIDGGYWLPTKPNDPRVVDMYLRHYSSKKNAVGNKYHDRAYRYRHRIVGPGEYMVLITLDGRACYVWRKSNYRLDKQEGVNCAIFRNELLSSMLADEADDIAWQRWPNELRHFTYVEDSQIQSANPGYCFKKAGWRTCGRNQDGRLTLLERIREQ